MVQKAGVEAKVKAAAVWALGGGLGLSVLVAVLQAVLDSPDLLAGLPAWVQPLVVAAVTAALAFLGGYRAAHTPRE